MKKKEVDMAKIRRKYKSQALNIIAWITGIIVSLAVGFGLIGGTLSVPYIGIVNVFFGWLVIATTIVGIVMVLFRP